jgi:hypothetical protein
MRVESSKDTAAGGRVGVAVGRGGVVVGVGSTGVTVGRGGVVVGGGSTGVAVGVTVCANPCAEAIEKIATSTNASN